MIAADFERRAHPLSTAVSIALIYEARGIRPQVARRLTICSKSLHPSRTTS